MFHFCDRHYAAFIVSILAGSATACSPYAYVADGGSISFIDTGSNTVVANVPNLGGIAGIAVNPAESRVYATRLPTDAAPDGIVHVISTRTNALLTSVPIVTGTQGEGLYGYTLGIAVAPDGTRAYVAASLVDWKNFVFPENFVAVMDTGTNTVVDMPETSGRAPPARTRPTAAPCTPSPAASRRTIHCASRCVAPIAMRRPPHLGRA